MPAPAMPPFATRDPSPSITSNAPAGTSTAAVYCDPFWLAYMAFGLLMHSITFSPESVSVQLFETTNGDW